MIGLLEAYAADVGQGGTLGILDVLHQAAGGTQGGLALVDAKSHQILGAELLAQELASGAKLKLPLRAATQATAPLDVAQELEGFRVEQLRRIGALQLRQQGLFFLELVDEEAAGAYVHGAVAEAAAIVIDGGDQVVLSLAEQRLVGDCARGDDANDLALHRPLAGGGIPHLFADGGRFAELHQLGQIALDGVIGDARHGNGAARGLAALGQGDVEQLGRLAGIVIEQLVEVAHPVEQQDLRVLGLEAKVLLHHGGVGAQVGAGGLVLCCHVLFQKVLLRASVCRNGSESGGHSTWSGRDGEGLSRFGEGCPGVSLAWEGSDKPCREGGGGALCARRGRGNKIPAISAGIGITETGAVSQYMASLPLSISCSLVFCSGVSTLLTSNR